MAKLFGDEGVHVVEASSLDKPSTAGIRDAMLTTAAAKVILLPNTGQLTGAVAAAVAEVRAAGVEVAVVPTYCPVQGLAAVAVHDPDRQFHDDVIAMTEAAAGTRWAEITVAEHEALTSVGRCQPGDVLGLIVGEVVEIGSSIESVARAVINRLLAGGGELLTIITGLQAQADHIDALHDHVRASQPLVEIAIFDGGQPRCPLLIGVE
jgi:dihydroxyacetone kinase-like predicted kinase